MTAAPGQQAIRRLAQLAREGVDRDYGGDMAAAATAWGVPYDALYRLLSGRTTVRGPSLDTLIALARAVGGGSLDTLLGLTEAPDDDPTPDPD